MNLGQFRLRVQQTVGADDSSGGEEEVMVNDIVNEAVRDIKARTRLSMKCLDITIAPDQTLFDIPDDILYMYGVFDSKGQRWKRTAPELVDEEGEFATIGNDLFKLTPASGERTLSAYYVAAPTPMTLDTHDPSDETYGGIPLQFHPAILLYANWQVGMILEHPSSRLGENFRLLYEGKDPGTDGGQIARIKRFVNTRIQPAGVRRPGVDHYRATSYI